MMNARRKILVAAYACNPRLGSEEGVGWGWVTALAARHDLWVLTAAFHRDDIEGALAADAALRSRLRFVYVPHRWWHYRPTPLWRRIENSLAKPIMNWAYRLWQLEAYRLARRLHAEVRFDLAHQLTYVGFRFPGHLWKLDVPFVWGPIGGLENTPWRFLPMLGLRGCCYYAGRNLINAAHRRWLRAPRRALARAGGGVIAATQGIQREILRWYGMASEVITETGPPPCMAAEVRRRGAGEPLRLCWSGAHQPGKALPLLLRALATLPPDVCWELDILGGGPCTRAWRRLARRLGVDARCRWHGQVPREAALGILGQAHVFVITSIKDLTSSVIMEALAQGVPVICPDHCGFADVITEECGIKLPLRTPGQVVTDLAAAVQALAGDEQRRQRLAAGGLRRLPLFSWEEKARRVDAIYQRLWAGRTA